MPLPPTRHSRRQAAFSLLELVIVIGILTILATMAFIGFGSLRKSQDKRNTAATMEIARSMFNAMVASSQAGGNNLTVDSGNNATAYYLKLAPPQWFFNPDAFSPGTYTLVPYNTLKTTAATIPYAKTIDFYNVPQRAGNSPAAAPIAMDVPLPCPSPPPGLVKDAPLLSVYDDPDPTLLETDWLPATGVANYPYRWQLWNTMLTIRRMRTSPEAKSMWSALRDAQIKHVGLSNSQEDFILDAWGRPLLFVPGSGLRGVQYGAGGPLADDSKSTRTSPASYVKLPNDPDPRQQGIRSPDGRPYWVSAGPDGYFDTQDDNIYSFNN